jgi:hypothetical protein
VEAGGRVAGRGNGVTRVGLIVALIGVGHDLLHLFGAVGMGCLPSVGSVLTRVQCSFAFVCQRCPLVVAPSSVRATVGWTASPI